MIQKSEGRRTEFGNKKYNWNEKLKLNKSYTE